MQRTATHYNTLQQNENLDGAQAVDGSKFNEYDHITATVQRTATHCNKMETLMARRRSTDANSLFSSFTDCNMSSCVFVSDVCVEVCVSVCVCRGVRVAVCMSGCELGVCRGVCVRVRVVVCVSLGAQEWGG